MASEDNEKAAVTQGNIMKWAEFTYKVAIGEISGNTTMAKIGVSGIAELFPRLKGQTVSSFFGIHNIGDVKQRAAGSLVHMIQDSYASGHAQREQGADGKKGKVISFHSYSGQDHDKHGHDDAFQGKGSDQNKLKRTPGALDAVEQSAQMFKFIHERRSWEDVKLYLEMEVFGLIPGALPAGTGNPYLKKGRTREPEYVRPGIPKDTGDYELRKRRLVEG